MESWEDYGDFSKKSIKQKQPKQTKSTPNKSEDHHSEQIETQDLSTQDLPNQDLNASKRQVPYSILKNRGTSARKAKENRNPRVKKRMRYEKALKKLGNTKKQPTALESNYSGEKCGIRDDISKSRKFN